MKKFLYGTLIAILFAAGITGIAIVAMLCGGPNACHWMK